MSSLRKNVASQNITFQLIKSADGTPVTAGGAGNVSKDGGAQAACTGTFTHLGTGQWLYVPAQAETNATAVGFQFTGTGAINVNLHFFTDNWDTTAAVLTSGSGAAQIAVNGSGKVSGVVLTDTLTTYTGNTVQTGDAFARIGVAGVGLTNLGDTRIANLDAAVSTRMATYTQPAGFLAATFPGGTLANTTNIASGTITTVTNQLTAAAIATGVWQDATAGDFTTVSSIGKSLYTSGVVPGGAGGLFIAGSNAGTTVNFTGNLSGSVGSVTGNVGGSVASVTARVTANTDQLAGQTVTAAAGVTFPTSVASPTNITAGIITTATNLTNAPTAGDFTAAMKTSLNAATPASVVGAVGSVTGNVGGNVVGSVASVVGAVGSVTGAVGSVTGNVGGTVASVVGAVGSVTGNVGGSVASVTAAVTVGTIQAAASNIKKNTSFDLSFPMTDSTTHALATGLTVTAQRSIDGGAFAGCANAVSEVGSGIYNITLAATDTNGNSIMYKFTAASADVRLLEIITQP